MSGSVSDMACSPGPFTATTPTLNDVVKATHRLHASQSFPKHDSLNIFKAKLTHGQGSIFQLLMQVEFV